MKTQKFEEKEQNFLKEIEKSKLIIQRLQNEIDNMKIDSKYHLDEKENLSKDPLEFYDIIGNINSTQNGWLGFLYEQRWM